MAKISPGSLILHLVPHKDPTHRLYALTVKEYNPNTNTVTFDHNADASYEIFHKVQHKGYYFKIIRPATVPEELKLSEETTPLYKITTKFTDVNKLCEHLKNVKDLGILEELNWRHIPQKRSDDYDDYTPVTPDIGSPGGGEVNSSGQIFESLIDRIKKKLGLTK